MTESLDLLSGAAKPVWGRGTGALITARTT